MSQASPPPSFGSGPQPLQAGVSASPPEGGTTSLGSPLLLGAGAVGDGLATFWPGLLQTGRPGRSFREVLADTLGGPRPQEDPVAALLAEDPARLLGVSLAAPGPLTLEALEGVVAQGVTALQKTGIPAPLAALVERLWQQPGACTVQLSDQLAVTLRVVQGQLWVTWRMAQPDPALQQQLLHWNAAFTRRAREKRWPVGQVTVDREEA
jgi:hypothetical protein